ncbi:MAG: hypothetical protein WCF56_19770, partial [Pseudolabrys sp.]
YALPMGLRFELEGDLRNNPISGAHDLGFTASAGGRERKYGPMFNVLYDLSPWIPPRAVQRSIHPSGRQV